MAEGRLQDRKFFIADRILAKHDEKYMPPELKGLFKKMLSNIGNSILFLSVFLSLSIIYCSIKNLKSIDNRIDKNIYQLCLLQSTFVIISFFTLVAGSLSSDFSLISVYQNSHSLSPLLYKISGTWGNHEGSLLLWVLILTLFSYFFNHLQGSFKNYRIFTLIFQNILILGFLFFYYLILIHLVLFHLEPIEGLGLNPILQDPALASAPTFTLCWLCWFINLFFSCDGFFSLKLFWKIIRTINKKLGFSLMVLSNNWNFSWINMGLL